MSWEELHKKSTVVDLHSHPSLKSSVFHRDIGSSKTKLLQKFFKEKFWPFSGRVTFPKMEAGGVDVLLSTAYLLEQGWIDDMSIVQKLFWLFPKIKKKIVDVPYFDATMLMLDEMEQQIESYNKTNPERKVVLAKNGNDIKRAIRAGDMCVIHSVEGAHSLQGEKAGKDIEQNTIKLGSSEVPVAAESVLGLHLTRDVKKEILDNLDAYHERGVAYLGIAHFYPNRCVFPVFPYPEYGASHLDWREVTGRWDETKGLTPLGEEVVEKMLDLGMLIDVSHCTIKARKRIYDIVKSNRKKECLLASHVGAFEINPISYNLQDWELKWFADNGCVAGIIFMNYWLSQIDSGLGLKYIERTLNHITNVCGTDVAAIGTDFDGFTDPPDELVDMSELPRITAYLKGLDIEDDVIEKFLGQNALRLLTKGWGK